MGYIPGPAIQSRRSTAMCIQECPPHVFWMPWPTLRRTLHPDVKSCNSQTSFSSTLFVQGGGGVATKNAVMLAKCATIDVVIVYQLGTEQVCQRLHVAVSYMYIGCHPFRMTYVQSLWSPRRTWILKAGFKVVGARTGPRLPSTQISGPQRFSILNNWSFGPFGGLGE